MKKQAAFTLAEVLITLGIIGIVAALTMPSLIQKQNNKAAVTALKKAYSVLAQALQLTTIDKGDFSTWDKVTGNNTDSLYNWYLDLKPYLNVIRECKDNEGCFFANDKLVCGTATVGFVIADGISVCMDDHSSGEIFGVKSGISVIDFHTDVNGSKPPNEYGKDVFIFVLNEKGLIPAGTDNNSADCTGALERKTCAAKVLKEDKIDY
ncbi:MAG: type II secretion system GspH family protein [Heliobacteriaceae bacterium]|jgi:prepilin-type N-terminal cleavage/methylation domain-containing protein|nr:type II secretion system GspH family protein [Heliobacteriaceae bacterium]